MIIIYNCYGGSHSSVTAAAIHLHLLSGERTPTKKELLSLPFFDAQVAQDYGRLRFMGYDEYGNEVYIAGRKNMGIDYEKVMRILVDLAQGKQKDLVFVNTMPCVNLWMVVGGFLSRRLGWTWPGRYLVAQGTRFSYLKFVQLVRQVKEKYILKHREEGFEDHLH